MHGRHRQSRQPEHPGRPASGCRSTRCSAARSATCTPSTASRSPPRAASTGASTSSRCSPTARTSSNDDRNYNQYAGTLRGSYDLLPGVKPFVEVGADTRVHDLQIDRSGDQRNSDGMVVRGGTTFEFSRKLTGEISVGYITRRYKDPTPATSISGFVFDASLIWSATRADHADADRQVDRRRDHRARRLRRAAARLRPSRSTTPSGAG